MAKKILNPLDLRTELQAAGSAGTAGQMLSSGGSGVAPSWVTPTGTMVVGGATNGVPVADEFYNPFGKGLSYNGTERSHFILPFACTIKSFYIRGDANSDGTDQWKIFKNGTASSVAVTVANGSQSGSDLSNTISGSAGDRITIGCIAVGTFTEACWGFEIVPSAFASAFTTEDAQDAIGAMIDSSLVYVDGTPLLSRAALTGDVTASQGSNATTIANNAVTTAKIANNAVTLAKMADMNTNKLLGRSTASAGDPEEISIGTGLSLSAGTLTNTGMSNPLTTTGDIIYSSGGTTAVRLGIGSNGNHLRVVSGVPSWKAPNSSANNNVTATTGTTSTTGVMMGMGVSVTPNASGRVLFIATGTIKNNTGDDGAKVRLYYGTGSAPTNGAALTGTAIGGFVQMNMVTSGSSTTPGIAPFAVHQVVTGLTVGTTYWFDLAVAAITGGTASVDDVTITAIEL